MFIKRFETDKGVFYTLTIVNANEENKKKKFITCFIPEQLAMTLQKSGISIKSKGSADDE